MLTELTQMFCGVKATTQPYRTPHYQFTNDLGTAVPSKLRDQGGLIDTFQFPGDRCAEGQLLTPGFQERGQSNLGKF